MKNIPPYRGFEQGPIRPPSEAESLLIRITRNCPWNRCTFCPVYKGASFSLRPLEHILSDIDAVKTCVDMIVAARQNGSRYFGDFLKQRVADESALHAAYHFVAGGMKSIFLQDGNSLIIKPADLITILRHLKMLFPEVERITSYGRSHTIARISDDNLAMMAEAGLNRIHIGMESGSDTVLKRVRKGVDKATQIVAGQKVKRAGMELSEYIMPGLGGISLSKEHALESADALNQINPDFIRLRSLALPVAAPLTDEHAAGGFDKMGEVDTARELLLFLESLEGITSTVKSDHVLNLFSEVDGVLPSDREKMTAPIRKFLALPEADQVVFCIGRRTHRLARVDDLDNPDLYQAVKRLCDSFGATIGNLDDITQAIARRFI
ncbi:MAG: radical SAM protein [Desulfofustis sp.]|nr:radical SAM protein [Desulfofustis sp.]